MVIQSLNMDTSFICYKTIILDIGQKLAITWDIRVNHLAVELNF